MDFTYKGTTASSYGIILNSLGWYRKPARATDQFRIQGKDGSTVIDDSYEPFSIPCKITLTALTNIDAITAWLTGNGVLSYSGDSTKYRNVYITEAVEFKQSDSVWEANFNFFCADVYRYLATDSAVTKTTFPATYTNTGTISALPLLKVTGSGTISVTVGTSTMTVVMDTAYVYIDSLSREVYYDATTLKNRNATGTFPTFAVGSNTISKSGTVTSVEITPRTRFL